MAIMFFVIQGWSQTIPATIPYSCDFESQTEVSNWIIDNDTCLDKFWITTGVEQGAITGNSLHISDTIDGKNNNYSHTNNVVTATRLIESAGNGGYIISFDFSCGGFYSNDFVKVFVADTSIMYPAGFPQSWSNYGYSTNAIAIGNSSYPYMLNASRGGATGSTVRITAVIPTGMLGEAGNIKKLVFAWVGNNYSGATPPGAAIDNISITAITCNTPSGLVVNNIGTTSADFSFIKIGTESNEWKIQYKPSSITNWDNADSINVFDTIHYLVNLTQNTTYNIRVKSLCAANDESLWSSAINFTTECDALSNFPWTENFSVNPFASPTCWRRYSGELLDTSTFITTSSGWNTNNFNSIDGQEMKTTFLSSNMKYMTSTPAFDLGMGTGTTYSIAFDFKATASFSNDNPSHTNLKFAVVVSNDGGITWSKQNAYLWTPLQDADYTGRNIATIATNNVSHIIIPLTYLNSVSQEVPYDGVIKLGFYAQNISGPTVDLHIDNLTLDEYNPCITPYNLSIDDITFNSATFLFTELGEATSWEYLLLTDTNNFSSASSNATVITDDSVQFSNLLPNTTYYVYVRGVCNSGHSNWTSTSFTTFPSPATLPYSCNFESGSDSTWLSLSKTSGNFLATTKYCIGTAAGNGPSASGTNSIYTSADDGVSYNTSSETQYISLFRDIDFDTLGTIYDLTFDWRCSGYWDTWNGTLRDHLRVYLVNTDYEIGGGFPNEADTNIIRVDTNLWNRSDWESSRIQLPVVNGIKRLMFVQMRYYADSGSAIDNINIDSATCIIPSNVTVSTSADSLFVSWTNSGASGYIISYSNNIDDTVISVYVTADSNVITGLAVGTYSVKVAAVCSNDTTAFCDAIPFIIYPCEHKHACQGYILHGLSNGPGWVNWGVEGYVSVRQGGGEIAQMALKSGDFNDSIILSLCDGIPVEIWVPIDFYGMNTLWEIIDPNGVVVAYGYGDSSTVSPVATFIPTCNLNPCQAPSYLQVTGISGTSVGVSWTGNGTSYNIEYGPAGFTHGTGTSVSTSNNSIIIDGLNLNTEYDIYVQNICDTTIWNNTSFTTASCYYPCYYTLYAHDSYGNGWNIDAEIAFVQNGDTIFRTPFQAGFNKTFYFYTCPLDTVSAVWIDGVWDTECSFELLDANGDTVFAQAPGTDLNGILFQFASNCTPFCASPINLSVNNTTITSATISWTDTNSSDAYEIKLGSTGTPVLETDTSHTVSNLSLGTSYCVYVRSICDTLSGNSSEWDSIIFTTATEAVTTLSYNNITSNSATLHALTALENITAIGFEYKIDGAPFFTNISVPYQNQNPFSTNITSLQESTNYIFRAFATNNNGTFYGDSVSFTTLANVLPIIVTSPASNITQTSADLNGSVTAGTNPILTQGFEWRLANTTTWTRVPVTGALTYPLSGLTANTLYEYRAYATTAIDTTNGTILTFTTLANIPPSVTTEETNQITNTTATFHGSITQGTEEINARGFEYKLPTEEWADAVVLSATGINSISAEANNLQPYTSYNVRAYARTNSNTYYGQGLNFQTLTLTSIDQQPITVMMYPNPATNETKLIISGVSGDTKIVLNDVQGRILNTINTKAVNGVVEQTIDVKNLTKGVYYVRIQNSNLNRTNKLIVK